MYKVYPSVGLICYDTFSNITSRLISNVMASRPMVYLYC